MRQANRTAPEHWTEAITIVEPKGPVWETLERAAATLDQAGLPYAVTGAPANPRRARDGAEVMELIDTHGLDKAFAPRLHPAVRPEFKRLADIVQNNPA